MNIISRFPLIELDNIGDDDSIGEEENGIELGPIVSLKLLAIDMGIDAVVMGVADDPYASLVINNALGKLPVRYCLPQTAENI